jgi:hypothetical protein
MAERVRISGGRMDESNEGIDAQVDEFHNLHIKKGQINASNKTYEDTSFTSGDSPATHNFYADTGRVTSDGYIVCDGSGDIQVAISRDGLIYDDTFTIKKDEVVELSHVRISKIRVTHTGTDSSYRINLI